MSDGFDKILVDLPGGGWAVVDDVSKVGPLIEAALFQASMRLTTATQIQLSLLDGREHYVRRHWRSQDAPGVEDGTLVTIYGRLTPLDELVAEDQKVSHEHSQVGLVYGEWYSVICPDGEPGDHHVVDLEPITEDEFKAAKARRWA